jgi:two-component system nitrate/nitrite response regulator NarL
MSGSEPPAPISVVIADDHPLYRAGLAGAIRDTPGLKLVGEADDGEAALELILERAPDVILLDIKMHVDGPTVLGRLKRSGCVTPVVFLSAHLDSALIYSALESGAAGFLSKRADRAVICDALEAAFHGEVILCSEAQTALGKEIRFKRRHEQPDLTQREYEVLALATEGLSASQIGERLYLSSSTVKTHLAHLYDKLGVSDRAAAVAEAFRRGLIE